ncbi:MAG: DNA/RNA non-specific endonuclease, partial [Proteobacteria bacterium]|nr:DNA/RNA non-specific endonuclease [Pseudomonadota bacterium]
PVDAGGGGGGGGGAPASEKTPAAPVALEGSDAKGVVDNFASLGASSQAVAFPDLGTTADTKAKEAETTFQEALPDFTVEMSGEDSGETSTDVAPVAASSAAGQDSPQAAPEPVIEETQQLGSFQTGFSSSQALSGFGEGEEADTAGNARAIGSSISSMPTSDGSISTSAGVRPSVPLQGESDPQRVADGASTAFQESSTGLQAAHTAISESPGAELVQPLALSETRGAENLAAITVAPTAPVTDMAAYVDLGLSEDVKGAFDELAAPELDASVADMQSQVDTASAERDVGRDAALADANAEQTRLMDEAHADQTAAVAEQRAAISSERQSTMAQQAAAVADIQGEIDVERQSQMTGIDSRVTQERGKIDAEFAKGERDAASEVTKGEQDAERKRRESERESENRSWWEQACDFVADALASLADAIGGIFDAVRNAVSAIIDAVKDFAESVIAAAVQWINEQIAAFGAWLNEKIQGLLGDIFPELADALCAFVDGAVKLAQDAVSAIGDAMLAGLTAMLDAFEGALNAVLNVMQAAMSAALAMATALITGDWMAFLMMAIEAALQLAGISPDQFYGFIGRAEDTIQAILDDPGSFIGNVIDAVGQGFSQFADNFLTHLQTGFVEWLTGQAGDAGITMPSELNLAGIFDIVLQVMGLTPERIREKAAEYIGEENVAMIEHVWGFVDAAITNGLAGLWEHVQGYMSGLWDMVIGAIQDWLMERIIMAAVTRLATMFNPVGAIVNALITAWNLYTFLTEQISRIWGVVTAVVDTIGDIVAGNLSGAANMVEGALADLVPVAISLLANLLGLGGIGEKVREVIEGIQETVWNAIDSVVESVKGMFSGGSGTDTDTESSEETAEGDFDGQVGERKTFSAGDEGHTLWVETDGANANVMVASTPMTVPDRLTNWEGRIGQQPSSEEGQGGPSDEAQARTLLSSARTQSGVVETEAEETVASEGVEQSANDTQTEQAENTLVPTLRSLFELYQDDAPDLMERATTEGGTALAKYNAVVADPAAQGKLTDFEAGVMGRLAGGGSVYDAMKAEVASSASYICQGPQVPASEITANGGVSRVVDLPAIFNYHMPATVKTMFGDNSDAFSAAVNANLFDPNPHMTGQMRGQLAEAWWFARESAPSYKLAELIDELAINESPQYEKGAVRFDFTPADAMGGLSLHKPTAYDGMPFTQYAANPGGAWGVTEGGVLEAVAPAIDIAKATNRTTVAGSADLAPVMQMLSTRFAAGGFSIENVHDRARPAVEAAIAAKLPQLFPVMDATAAKAIIAADSTVNDMLLRPLGSSAFGQYVEGSQAVPQATAALAQVGLTTTQLGSDAATWVGRRKGQFTQGTPAYQASKTALNEELWDKGKEGDANAAMLALFVAKLTETKALHDKYRPMNLKRETLPNGDVKITYDGFGGAKFEVIESSDGMVSSITGTGLTLKGTQEEDVSNRGNTTSTGNRRARNQGQNSSHLVPDRLRGSGYKAGANLITTSRHFNVPVMSNIEDDICEEYGRVGAESVTLTVSVEWDELRSDDVVDDLVDHAASQAAAEITDPAELAALRTEIEANLAQYATQNSVNLKRVANCIYRATFDVPEGREAPEVFEDETDMDFWLGMS